MTIVTTIERKPHVLTRALFFQLGSDSLTFCTMLEDQTLSARKNIQLIISIWLALGAVHKNEKKKGQKKVNV